MSPNGGPSNGICQSNCPAEDLQTEFWQPQTNGRDWFFLFFREFDWGYQNYVWGSSVWVHSESARKLIPSHLAFHDKRIKLYKGGTRINFVWINCQVVKRNLIWTWALNRSIKVQLINPFQTIPTIIFLWIYSLTDKIRQRRYNWLVSVERNYIIYFIVTW